MPNFTVSYKEKKKCYDLLCLLVQIGHEPICPDHQENIDDIFAYHFPVKKK